MIVTNKYHKIKKVNIYYYIYNDGTVWRECISDEFVWDLYEETLLQIFSVEKFFSCLMKSLRDNVSLDELFEDMDYYYRYVYS